MTYLLTYLLLSPTLATLHIANVYYRQWRVRRREADEIIQLEMAWQMEAREPERRVS